MRLIYHRHVQHDVSAVLAYYDEVGGSELGDAFYAEFMAYVAKVCENPTRFHPVDRGLRRANLDRFPYHFLLRLEATAVRILVLRHHQRDAAYGRQRQ
jgi:hypothetical protein